MTFFSSENLKRRKIEIDQSSASCESPEVKKRLDRIQEHYRKLDTILTDLESRIASDERLKAIDAANVDYELTNGTRKKRKWRTAQTKAKRVPSSSSNPKKPR